VYAALAAEERNKPTATLANLGFVNDARSAASSRGMPAIRIVATSVPCEGSVMEEIETGINAAMDEIVAALTRPLSAEEKSPVSKPAEKPSRTIFKGDIQEVNRFFYRRGWGDGLPVLPPTEAAVAEMLTGTDLPADHVVAKLIPRLGKATVEKIAVNAVMAGALPTYMPLLIAGLELLADPTSTFGMTGVSTGSWAPFWIINGPVRRDLYINSGTGALSPGDIANAAIGRAMALIIKNIGGARKGVEDMGVQGNPGKYSLVLAENEEESPWEPLHVERGFKKEESTITVSFPNSYQQIWPLNSDEEGILRSIVWSIQRPPCIVMTPPHAKTLARRGWTKQDIKEFISEYARIPAYQSGAYWGTSSPASAAGGRPGLYKNRVPMRDTDYVRVTPDSKSISIVVAGGPGAFIGLHTPWSFGTDRKTTRKVVLPSGWDKLVAKYKDVVPVYARY
jgi:hypothetical protein